jgi:hypothetical protein
MAYTIIGEEEGPVSFNPVRGIAAPTRQDTLDLIQRSEDVRKFIENARDERGRRMYEADTAPSRKKSMPKAEAMKKLENAREAIAKKEYAKGKTVFASEKGRTSGVVPIGEYARQLSPERFEQREIESQIINPSAPMSMYDVRVKPDTVYLYKQRTKGGVAPDLVSIPGYSTRMLPDIEQAKPIADVPVIVAPVKRPSQRVPRYEDTPRVSFGTRGNRPTYQPGPGGRRGTSNRLQGRGAFMNVLEKIQDAFD